MKPKLKNIRLVVDLHNDTETQCIIADWSNDSHQSVVIEMPFDADSVGSALLQLARLIFRDIYLRGT